MEVFWQSFFGTTLSLSLGTALVFILRNWILIRLKESIKSEKIKIIFRDKEVWLMKRKACLQALKLANSVLSNYKYENLENGVIVRQYMGIEEARKTIDALVVSCEYSEVIDELKKIMHGRVKLDSIVDLRNAVRKELGFSKKVIDKDREKAFIGNLNCLPNLEK